MWTPLGRALTGVVWIVCGALMFAIPPDDDSDLADDLPFWGLVILAGGVLLVVHSLFQRAPWTDGLRHAYGRHANGRTTPSSGRDHFRATGASAIMLFGAMALLWAGVGRREVGIIATGVILATFAALLLPVAFPALRSFSSRE